MIKSVLTNNLYFSGSKEGSNIFSGLSINILNLDANIPNKISIKGRNNSTNIVFLFLLNIKHLLLNIIIA
jgi:hypothetical protein